MKTKSILITGSTSGIGFDIAKSLSKLEGYKIILNGRNMLKLKFAKRNIPNSNFFLCDVTKHKDLKSLSKKIKSLDILICNVGNSKSVKPGKEKIQDWKKSLDENFFSTINTINFFEKKLIKSKGIIICISSICGLEYIKGAPLTYSVSKSALNTFIRYYSKILGPKGVKLNGIAPGNILFKGSTWDKKLKKNKRSVNLMLKKDVSMRKLGALKDISGLVEFLVKSNSDFINGSIFVVDGGQIKRF